MGTPLKGLWMALDGVHHTITQDKWDDDGNTRNVFWTNSLSVPSKPWVAQIAAPIRFYTATFIDPRNNKKISCYTLNFFY